MPDSVEVGIGVVGYTTADCFAALAMTVISSPDGVKGNPGVCISNRDSRITKYIHVFCPRAALSAFKFDPVKFSARCFIRATW